MEQTSRKIVKRGREKEISRRLAKVYENDIKPYTPLILGNIMVNQLLSRLPKNYFKVNRKILIVSDCGLLWSMLQKIKDLNLYEKIEIVFLCHTKKQQEFASELKSHFNIFIEFLSYNKLGDKIMNYEFVNFKEFEIIVGNPPYQKADELGGRGSKTNTLYIPFIEKSLDSLNAGGYLLFITANGWLSKKDLQGKILNDFNIFYLNINGANKYFSVGSLFSWYIIEKTNENKKTIVDCYHGSKEYLNQNVDLRKFDFIPSLTTELSYSIIDKIRSKKLMGIEHSYSFERRNMVKKRIFSNEKDTVYKYKFYHTPSQILWSSVSYNERGVAAIPMTQNISKLFYTTDGLTEMFCYYPIKKNDFDNFYRYINSKVIKFYITVCKWSGFYSHHILKSIPYFDYTNDWSDEDLYKHFKLTKDEIKMVEENV